MSDLNERNRLIGGCKMSWVRCRPFKEKVKFACFSLRSAVFFSCGRSVNNKRSNKATSD